MRLGPFTIAHTSTWNAYRNLATVTWELHRAIWYGNPDAPNWKKVMSADGPVADALSRVPQEHSLELAKEIRDLAGIIDRAPDRQSAFDGVKAYLDERYK